MKRDHNQLKVFGMADDLVVPVYERTRDMPAEERFGLQAQLRRAAVSVPTNIVEGCSRPTPKDFTHFLVIAHGSAVETRYLLSLSYRLGLVHDTKDLVDRYDQLCNALSAFIRTQT